MARTKVTSESSPEEERKAASAEKAVAVPIFFKSKWEERIKAMREEINAMSNTKEDKKGKTTGKSESPSDNEAIRSCFKNAPGLADLSEYLYLFNCHGMFRLPDEFGRGYDNPLYSGPDRNQQRVKGQMSELEICLKLKCERDDRE